MKVELVAYTQMLGENKNPLSVCERAASVCYNSRPTSIFAIAKACKKSGHMSVLEHINFTFHITGVSRALLAQLSRHRHISMSVRSQRYCNEGLFAAVYPKSVYAVEGDDWGMYDEALENANRAYRELIEKGVPAEDARMVLPNACFTELYMTANARSLIEMSRIRLCTRAQWEIRDMFKAIKAAVEPVCPEVAGWMRPKCEEDPEHPFCTEEKCCGRHPKLESVCQIGRCKNCKNASKHGENMMTCNIFERDLRPDDFCSQFEQK